MNVFFKVPVVFVLELFNVLVIKIELTGSFDELIVINFVIK